MMPKKCNKPSQIYEYIKKQINEKGYPPTVREICSAVGLKSTSTVHSHLITLEKKGLIKRDPTKPRAIELIKEPNKKNNLIDIPIIGTVAAGTPILAVENIDGYLSVPAQIVNNSYNLYALNVKGNSMIDAGIFDGDYVIIRKTSTAENGDIVVALIDNIDGSEVTIKRFFKEDNYFRLQPENSQMEPIIVKDCQVIGKLVALFRKYF